MITIEQLKDVKERTAALERYLDIENKLVQVEEEQLRTQAPGFWDDAKKAEAQMRKVKDLQKWIDGYREVKTMADELELAFDFCKDDLVTDNAAMGGARHVTAVDVSQFAVDTARENAERNGLTDRMDFLCADVFDLLPKLLEEKADYDMIILDPPAFTKSRKTVGSAERGYKEINYRAMRLLPRGGYLATCSCSHFMENRLFVKMVMSAAKDAGVQLKLIEARQQAPDHPILLNVPETDYLKFYLFQVV